MSMRVIGVVLTIIGAAIMLGMCVSVVIAKEHEHGINLIPDWYDPACCSQRDCKPVDDKDVEFGQDGLGNSWARYKPTGNTFYRYQFKQSQDERYHVCINPAAQGNNGALCFYDRAGA